VKSRSNERIPGYLISTEAGASKDVIRRLVKVSS
jgi:hypothetical protein